MTLQARKRTAAPEADEHTAADAAPQPAARRAAGTWAARRGSSSWHAGLAICAIALVGAVAYMAPSVSAGK